MATKKPTIAPIGVGSRTTPSVDYFIAGAPATSGGTQDQATAELAAANAEERRVRAEIEASKEKKKQVPIMILPGLLEEIDRAVSKGLTGQSRSTWICQAIREKLDSSK